MSGRHEIRSGRVPAVAPEPEYVPPHGYVEIYMRVGDRRIRQFQTKEKLLAAGSDDLLSAMCDEMIFRLGQKE